MQALKQRVADARTSSDAAFDELAKILDETEREREELEEERAHIIQEQASLANATSQLDRDRCAPFALIRRPRTHPMSVMLGGVEHSRGFCPRRARYTRTAQSTIPPPLAMYRAQFEREKQLVADVNAGSSDIISLNIGGNTAVAASRNTLTQCGDSMLAAMFSGRHTLRTDDQGRVFIDGPTATSNTCWTTSAVVACSLPTCPPTLVRWSGPSGSSTTL